MWQLESLEARRMLSAGSLDPTFQSGGRGVIQFGERSLDTVFGSAVQPDGKIVIVGSTNALDGNGTDLAVARLNPDATLDRSFGVTIGGGVGGGLFEIELPTNTDTAFGVAIQTDGKIVIVGSVAEIDAEAGLQFGQAVVIRLDANGIPDDTFGTNLPEGETGGLGFVFLPLSTDEFGLPNSEARAVGLQSNGKIVIGGAADLTREGTSSFAVARLNGDGSLDRSFGASGTGIEVQEVEGFFTAVLGLAVTPDDRIGLTGTAVGSDGLGGVVGLFVTARLLANGLEDLSFGDEGVAVTVFPIDFGETVLPLATSVVVQPDGKILVGGFIIRSFSFFGLEFTRSGIALARFNADGSPDLGFGGGTGFVETYLGNPNDPAANLFSNQIVLTTGGKFLVAGRVARPDSTDLSGSVVARYNANGSLDGTFNRNGLLVLFPEGEIRPQSTPAGMNFENAAQGAGTLVAEVPGGGIYLIATRGEQIAAARLIADGPDLITRVDRVRAGTFLGGTKATASVLMSNQGTLPFAGTVPVQLFLSRDNVLSAEDVPVITASSRVSLKPGQTRAQTVRYVYPRGEAVEGQFFVLANANESRAVSEGNFVNNASASPVTVMLAPAFVDLSAALVSGPTGPVSPGTRASFSVRLVNSGTIPAAGSVVLQLLASQDEATSPDDLLLAGSRPTRVSLRPGERVLRFSSVVPREQPSGTYRLILKLDATALGGREPVRVVVSELLLTIS